MRIIHFTHRGISYSFQLKLDVDGKPYTLRQWFPNFGKSGSWRLVWANWHKSSIPTGIAKQAIESIGWRWHNSSPTDYGWFNEAAR